MDSQSHSARSVGGRLNLLMGVAIVVPALLLFVLGWVSLHQVGGSSGLPADTLVWGWSIGLSLVAAVVAAGAWLRMRGIIRTHTLELAEVARQGLTSDRLLRARVAGEDEFAVLATAINAVLDGTGSQPGGGVAGASGDPQDAATLQA